MTLFRQKGLWVMGKFKKMTSLSKLGLTTHCDKKAKSVGQKPP